MGLPLQKQWVTSANVSGPQRMNGPRRRIQGISLRVDLADGLDQVVELEAEAYKKMGGTTKPVLSDFAEPAFEDFLRAYQAKNGPLPQTDGDRKRYVEKLAESHQAELRARVLAKPD